MNVASNLSGLIEKELNTSNNAFFHIKNNYIDKIPTIKNKGNLHFSGNASLKTDNITNLGSITSEGDLSILANILNNNDSNALILAKQKLDLLKQSDDSNFMIGRSAGRQIRVNRHTDHYLNTITHYYINGVFSHTTETGPVFQRRETNTEYQDIDEEQLNAINAYVNSRSAILLETIFKEFLAKMAIQKVLEEIESNKTLKIIDLIHKVLDTKLKGIKTNIKLPILHSPLVYDFFNTYKEFTFFDQFDKSGIKWIGNQFNNINLDDVDDNTSSSSDKSSDSDDSSSGSSSYQDNPHNDPERSYLNPDKVQLIESASCGEHFVKK